MLESHRGRLFGLAYRMLGDAGAAEDMVQETFLRWESADTADVANPGGWLTTTCTRLCLDRLRSARHQRETYVGPWLPEPLLTDEDADPAGDAERAESLTLAFLVVLESLSPAERVAFLLHDVFDYPHDEIAAILDRSPAAVRQLASRARRSVRERRPRFEPDAERRQAVADAFMAAWAEGEVGTLLELLAPEVTFAADSGGLVPAARRPVSGPDAVAKLLLGILRLAPEGAEARPVDVNGMPGMGGVVDGQLVVLMAFDIRDGAVAAVHAIRNPEKLRRAAVRAGLRPPPAPERGIRG